MNLCDKRGCYGPPKDRPVWVDGLISTRTCPVLAYTAEVREWLAWFGVCYAVQSTGLGGAACVRVAWPAAGGAGDQDARLLMALEFMAGVVSAVLAEQARSVAHG